MRIIKKIVIAIIAAIPMIGFAQPEVKLTKDTKGFYGFGYVDTNNGKPVKPFSMTTPDGKKIESKDLKGKIVVLDFWSTWCSPCRTLTKELNDSLAKYNGDDFLMIGVNYNESIKKGNPFKYWQEHGYKFPMTINNDAYGKAVGAGNPTVIIIDKEGIVRGQFDGYSSVTTKQIETLVWAVKEKPEISIESVVLAGRDKEYVKALYLADEVMKKDTVQGKELISEKFKAMLRVSEWEAVEYIQKAINQAKTPDELEGYLTEGGIHIAEADKIQSPKIYLFGAELFEQLIVKYNLGEEMVVNDLMGRCYFKGGNKTKALQAAKKSLAIAQNNKQSEVTLNYLRGVLEKYTKS